MQSPLASAISDPHLPHNPIIAANPAFCALTGYEESEIVGRNCRFLTGPGTEPWLTERIAAGIRRRRPVMVEILNYRRDRTPFRNALLIAPVFRPDGEIGFFMSSQAETPDGDGPELSRREKAVRLVATLSPRQEQVLREVAAGLRSKQIAWKLALSEKTVKMHRALMLAKLDAPSMADAVRIAVEAGL